MSDHDLLNLALQTAVPLWVDRLLDRDDIGGYMESRAPEIGQIVAEKGDVILYRSKRRGQSAYAFNALAEGIALGSFLPGGVTFMGTHYENVHPFLCGVTDEIARMLRFEQRMEQRAAIRNAVRRDWKRRKVKRT